jgi:hypothetical protein
MTKKPSKKAKASDSFESVAKRLERDEESYNYSADFKEARLIAACSSGS